MPDKNTFLALLNLVIENKDEREGHGKQKKKKTSDYNGKKTRPGKTGGASQKQSGKSRG